MRKSFGSVDGSGKPIVPGSGDWRVVDFSNGMCEIEFLPPHATAPAVTVTPIGDQVLVNLDQTGPTATGFKTRSQTPSYSLSFMAVSRGDDV